MKAFTILASFFVAITAIQGRPAPEQPGALDMTGVNCPAAGEKDTFRTPSYPNEQTAFTICSEVVIDAPVQKIYDAILAFADYPSWNDFVVKVYAINGSLENVKLYDDIRLKTKGILPLHLSSLSDEVISVLQPGEQVAVIAWRKTDGVEGNLQDAEHVWYIASDKAGGGKQTRVVSRENFYGAVAHLTALLKWRLQEQFDLQNRQLKDYVEQK